MPRMLPPMSKDIRPLTCTSRVCASLTNASRRSAVYLNGSAHARDCSNHHLIGERMQFQTKAAPHIFHYHPHPSDAIHKLLHKTAAFLKRRLMGKIRTRKLFELLIKEDARCDEAQEFRRLPPKNGSCSLQSRPLRKTCAPLPGRNVLIYCQIVTHRGVDNR